MTNTTPPRHESASAPARSHRHPFLQARRQPHQHAPAGHEAGDNASALDVTAAEKRQHHHHVDVEGGGGAPSMPSLASPLVVAPAPGDPAHPLNDGESHEGDDEHVHYSHRAPWLRAAVLGANDGLVSTASLMLGVGGGTESLRALVLAGVAGLVAGALSMAVGEYISVSSQRDSEEADVEKERREQEKGPAARAHELAELAEIYEERGLTKDLALAVAKQLTERDVIRAHARDELGIDLDDMSNALQAAFASSASFTVGAAVPLLAAAFIQAEVPRLLSLLAAALSTLIVLGATGAALGGAPKWKGALRILIGGGVAMGITYGIGRLFNITTGGSGGGGEAKAPPPLSA